MTETNEDVRPLVDGVLLPTAEDGRPRLLIAQCEACEARFFPPRERCAACSGTDMSAAEAPTDGELYTWTVIRELGRPMEGFVPYVVGQVDLADDLRVTGIVQCDPDELEVGMKLRVCLIPQGRDDEGELVGYGFEPA
jgi:uncharacterized OB-fold protein